MRIAHGLIDCARNSVGVQRIDTPAAAGRFHDVSPRKAFPLKLRAAGGQQASEAIVIGNAAQTLHPVAGQGLNLGLRDAAVLARLLIDCAGDYRGAAARFRTARDRDRDRTVGFTDFLVRRFSTDAPVITGVRGAALTLLDVLPPARRYLARAMMFGSAT